MMPIVITLSDAMDGAGVESLVVFGVIIGTGTGGGIVIDRKVLTGSNAIAGEWGHNPLPWPRVEELEGSVCYCGRRGCIETWLSGPGIARDHRQISGKALDAEAIVRWASAGDVACEATLQRYEDRLARSLTHAINILDPDVIVLGGGLSNIHRLYHTIPNRWGHYVFSDQVNTRLLPPVHGDSSGVRGAAWLWQERSAAESKAAYPWLKRIERIRLNPLVEKKNPGSGLMINLYTFFPEFLRFLRHALRQYGIIY